MNDTNKPVGYDHDKKGASGGDTKVEGRPNVAHTGPADKVQGKGAGGETVAFTLDGEEMQARAGETIWQVAQRQDRKSTRLNSSHVRISYAVFCLKKKKKHKKSRRR